MNTIIPWIILILPLVIGYVVLIFELYKKNKKKNEIIEYREILIQFVNDLLENRCFDNKIYFNLTKNVNRIQKALAFDGVITIHDPLNGSFSNNYQVLINFLPQTREYLLNENNQLWCERFDQLYRFSDDSLIRHIGTIEEDIKCYIKHLINPIYIFVYGVRCIITFPFKLLFLTGVLSDSATERIFNSGIVSVCSVIVSIISVFSDIVSIIIGWDQFYLFLKAIVDSINRR